MRKVYVPLCAGLLSVASALPFATAQTPGELILYAGTGTPGNTGDEGPATSAELYSPTGITLDKSGNLYIADSYNNCVRKVAASTGMITDVAGECGSGGYSGDGGLATDAKLGGPSSIAFDSAGDMYIADTGNYVIRKVDAATGVITTVAGNGSYGDTGDGGPAILASLMYPQYLTIDQSGNVYFTGIYDNVVRKVAVSTGIITQVAGTGTQGYTGDGGPAIDAELSNPYGVAIDSAGNLYIADQTGNAIRKVTASTGTISTVVGNGVGSYSGDGGLARNATVNNVQNITFDGSNNLYIADEDNDRIRKVAASNQVITTVAGNGFGQPTLNAPALEADFEKAWGIAVDANDNFYISDNGNMQAYKVIAGGPSESTTSLSTQGTTSLSLQTSEVMAGQVFNLTAQVAGSLDSPEPTGTVTFYEQNLNQNTTTQTELGQVPLDSSGAATFSLSLPDGDYQLTASYSGNNTYFSSSSGVTVEALSMTAAAPSFSPAAGTYTYSLQVVIHANTPGVPIVYTTDGSTPTYANGTPYTGAIPVTANTTIKAVAMSLTYPAQYLNSPVASASYVINLPSETALPQGQWGWESGASAPTAGGGGCGYVGGYLGDYGILGVAAPDNVPGGRTPATQWTDNNGDFWIFGGETIAGPQDEGCNLTNDLWMFNPTTQDWTWMSGSDTYSPQESPAGMYGTRGKFAPGNVPGGRASAVSWTDKAGNLWLFGGTGYGSTEQQLVSYNDLWEFNPSTRQWAWIAGSNTVNQSGSYGTLHAAASGNTPGARWGAAGWTDQKGNLWMFGGEGYDSAGNQGDMNDLWEFNPSTLQWAWMGGSQFVNQPGVYGYLHDPSTANIPGARDSGMAWVDKLGEFWFFGGEGLGATKTFGMFNDLWEFNPSDLTWTWAMGSADGGTYGQGSGNPGQGGVYGLLGVPDPGNTPGSRTNSATFTDAQGNLWLYGGLGYDSVGNLSDLDDVWEFDRTKWIWAWMGGHEVAPSAGSYATYGPYRVPSSQTQPGPREGAAGFTDKNGNPWLFGGAYSSGPQVVILYNDLLEYQLP